MARIFYHAETGVIYGVHPGAFDGQLPEGISFMDVPESPDKIMWPDARGEKFAKVQGDTLVAHAPMFPVPASVTKLQLVRALRTAGLWGDVKGALKVSGTIVKEDWEYAFRIDRTDSMMATFAEALGLTPETMDQVFMEAATL